MEAKAGMVKKAPLWPICPKNALEFKKDADTYVPGENSMVKKKRLAEALPENTGFHTL